MAKSKAAAESVSAEIVADNARAAPTDNSGRKHVALDQLHIVREYIDKRDGLSVASAEGVHGLRYYNGKLQVMDVDGTWVDIIGTSGAGTCDCPEDIKGAEVATDNEVADMFGV